MNQMSFEFDAPRRDLAPTVTNDYHHVPASEKQLRFAHNLAARLKVQIPNAVLRDRSALSAWIDQHKGAMAKTSKFSNYPSSKQVAFAERIARMKRRAVPNACFKDRTLMSRWIDSHI